MDIISDIIYLLYIYNIIKNLNNIYNNNIKYMKSSISARKIKKVVRKSWDEIHNYLTETQFRRYFRMDKYFFKLLSQQIQKNLGNKFKSLSDL